MQDRWPPPTDWAPPPTEPSWRSFFGSLAGIFGVCMGAAGVGIVLMRIVPYIWNNL